jgi:hypothetical protein
MARPERAHGASGRRVVSAVRFIACAVLIVTLGGCATRHFRVSVPAEHLDQPPLIERLPLTIGIAYAPNFRAYRHVTEHKDMVGRVVWDVDLGEASVVMFDQVFAAMFERVVSIESTAETPHELNGVLEVRIQEVRFDLTEQSPVPLGGSITYGFTLRNPAGAEEIASWSVTGTGRRGGAVLITGWELVRQMSTAALRSSAAQFMVGFAEPMTVQEWLGRQGVAVKKLAGER